MAIPDMHDLIAALRNPAPLPYWDPPPSVVTTFYQTIDYYPYRQPAEEK